MADLPGVGVGEGGRLLGSLVLKVSRGRKPQATFPRPAIHSGFMETESSVIDLLQALQQTLIKRMGGKILLRYVLHAIHSRQCGWLHQRRKHGAPRRLRAQRSTVDHRGARPFTHHARPP